MTGERNRDRSIERVLQRSLAAGFEAPVTDACLDAETLAAWVDGGLDEQAMAMAEAHTSACARCQALVGAMARSAPKIVVPARWWRRERGIPWLVPVTAAAAALVLWIVVPSQPTRSPMEERGDLSLPAERETTLRAAPEKPPAAPPPATAGEATAKRELRSARRSEDRNRVTLDAAPEQKSVREEALQRAPAAAPAAPAEAMLGRLAESVATAEIVSPDPAIRWRLASGGRVSYSTDGGITWETVSTGVSSDLTAGSSPSPSVCWLVGRSGVVLLTTDGRRWQRVPFPEVVDLTSVQAVASGTVIVMTADGRTFRTQDAGKTWTQGPVQVF